MDPVPPAALGCAAWALALGVLLLTGDDLATQDHRWRLWTAVAGLVIGLALLAWALRRRRQTVGDPGATGSGATRSGSGAAPSSTTTGSVGTAGTSGGTGSPPGSGSVSSS